MTNTGLNMVIDNISFSDTSSFNFYIEVEDLLGNSNQSSESFVPTAKVLLNYKAGGEGLGVGKAAETNSFEVGLPSIFFGQVYISDPKGETMETLEDYIKSVVEKM